MVLSVRKPLLYVNPSGCKSFERVTAIASPLLGRTAATKSVNTSAEIYFVGCESMPPLSAGRRSVLPCICVHSESRLDVRPALDKRDCLVPTGTRSFRSSVFFEIGERGGVSLTNTTSFGYCHSPATHPVFTFHGSLPGAG